MTRKNINQSVPRSFRFLALFVCVATPLASQNAPPNPPLKPEPTVSVELVDRPHAGDWVSVRVRLQNSGRIPFYVSHEFGTAGGNIPGFFLKVTQLSGRPSHLGGGIAGDAFLKKDERPMEQRLKEDFVLLAPGQFVGTELELGSVVEYAGRYRVEVSYRGWSLDPMKFEKEPPKYPFVEKVDARPFVFTLTK